MCKVTFDMYQGALASFLNVLDKQILNNHLSIFNVFTFAAQILSYPTMLQL
jgi:hypothetical protein